MTEVWVDARNPWQPTGVHVRKGNHVEITVFVEKKHRKTKDWWYHKPGLKNAGEGIKLLKAGKTYAVPGEREGGLVCKHGDTKRFVGRSKGFEADFDAELLLMINDEISPGTGAGLSDNKGEIHVRIKIYQDKGFF